MKGNFLKNMLGAAINPPMAKSTNLRGPAYHSSTVMFPEDGRQVQMAAKQVWRGAINPQQGAGAASRGGGFGAINPSGRSGRPSISMPASPVGRPPVPANLSGRGIVPNTSNASMAPSRLQGPSASPRPASARVDLGAQRGVPSVSSNAPLTASGASALMQVGGMAAGGALIGGTASYATGGHFGQGAMMGALAAGGGAGIARGLGTRGVGGYGPKISGFMNDQSHTATRRAAFGAGAMLAGGMFGGNRSHRRGFNARRGNSIGR